MSWVLVCLTHVKVETVVDLNDYHIKRFSGLGRYLLAMLGCLAIAKLLGAWRLVAGTATDSIQALTRSFGFGTDCHANLDAATSSI